LLGLLVVLVIGALWHESKTPSTASSSKAPGRGRMMAFPVKVEPVSTRTVEYAISAVGSVEAFEIVQVTARVPGAIERIQFREGDNVKKGQTLIEIEPERYQLATEEAKAALEKAKASLAEAEAGRDRRQGANDKTPGLIPGEEISAWSTRVTTAQAEVGAAEAGLELAKRNARDARAEAPFAGTIQSRNVQTGQYVAPGALLTTLVRRDPLLVRCQIPEGDAAHVTPGMVARFTVRNDQREHHARIVAVAGSADLTSRMVPITAEVTDSGPELRPGAFAEITIPVGSKAEATVAPETAIRPSERGFLAYVVRNGVAEERVLTLGLRTPDGMVEVRNGLSPNDSLVVRGAEALRNGAKVRVVTEGEAVQQTPTAPGNGS
jgi:multidrug efflux system membrane fusion protein